MDLVKIMFKYPVLPLTVLSFPLDQCQQGLRKKRDLNSRDDTIDDQDDIPPFEPAIRNNTITPATWPTPTGLTKQDVTNLCNKKIRSSKAGETCGKITGVDIDALVQQCVSDIQVYKDSCKFNLAAIFSQSYLSQLFFILLYIYIEIETS